MPTVVGVKLRFSKILCFDPAGRSPAEGDTVIVETERGTEIGVVAQAPHDVAKRDSRRRSSRCCVSQRRGPCRAPRRP